ncbi:hypothetical protein JHK86_009738 [Glycine max]|nr:hypothetical protein JHK86_009738 [Glycine max]
MLPLKEIIDGIHGQVAKNEDDLKDEDGEKHFEAKLQQIEARFYVAFGCQYGPVRPVLAHHKLASPTHPAKQNGLPFLARPFSS